MDNVVHAYQIDVTERTRMALVSERLTADVLEKIGLSVDTDKPPLINSAFLQCMIVHRDEVADE